MSLGDERAIARQVGHRSAARVLGLVMVGWLAFSNCSCTAIGFGIGSAATRNQPPRRVPGAHALQIQPGTHVGIVLSDTEVRYGTLLGRTMLDDSTYAIRFQDWNSKGRAPILGGRVQLRRRDGGATSGVFAGFGLQTVLIRSGYGAAIDEVQLRNLIELRADTGTWSRAELARLGEDGRLPLRDAVWLRQVENVPAEWFDHRERNPSRGRPGQAPEIVIAFQDVLALEIPSSRTARHVLTAAGLFMDLLAIGAMSFVW